MLARFHVIFYSDFLTYVLSFVDLTIAALPDELQLLDVFFLNQKLKCLVVLKELVQLSDLSILVRSGLGLLSCEFLGCT